MDPVHVEWDRPVSRERDERRSGDDRPVLEQRDAPRQSGPWYVARALPGPVLPRRTLFVLHRRPLVGERFVLELAVFVGVQTGEVLLAKLLVVRVGALLACVDGERIGGLSKAEILLAHARLV